MKVADGRPDAKPLRLLPLGPDRVYGSTARRQPRRNVVVKEAGVEEILASQMHGCIVAAGNQSINMATIIEIHLIDIGCQLFCCAMKLFKISAL